MAAPGDRVPRRGAAGGRGAPSLGACANEGGSVTVKTLAIAVAIALAAGIGIGYFARPQPTVHRVATDTVAATRTTTADVAAKTSQASEQEKTEAPKTKVTT